MLMIDSPLSKTTVRDFAESTNQRPFRKENFAAADNDATFHVIVG